MGSWGGISSFAGVLKGTGDGRRVGGGGDWRLDWRDGGEEGRDDMLSAAAVDDGYMFSVGLTRDVGFGFAWWCKVRPPRRCLKQRLSTMLRYIDRNGLAPARRPSLGRSTGCWHKSILYCC